MTRLRILSTTALARALVPVLVAVPDEGSPAWTHIEGAAR
jgi:hypothetical protein